MQLCQNFKEKLNNGEFKALVLPSGKYYISSVGQIVSMNTGVPKIIRANQRATGEKHVVLFIPSPSIFGVAELILMTFVGKPPENAAPCYKDFNPGNICLENLYWGDMDAQVECRNKQNIRFLESAIEAQQAVSTVDESVLTDKVKKPETMLFVNKAMLQDLMMYSVALNRHYLANEFADTEIESYKSVSNLIAEIAGLNAVKKSQFNRLFKPLFCHELVQETVETYRLQCAKHHSLYQTM